MQKRSLHMLLTGTALALALAAVPMQRAQAVSSDVVISQVYGGGGNTGAPYTNDFIELFNRGTTTVSLSGWSVQYASATGSGNFGSNPVTALSGSVAPGQYYLVQQSGGATGVALPTPDAIGTVNMSGASGKVALVTSTTGLACNGGSTPCAPSQLAAIKDLVGYGSANFFEGAGAAPGLSNTTAALRAANGCTETDNNSNDFASGAPTPRNTASPVSPCPVGDSAPVVTSTVPTNGASDFPIGANLSVTFSEPVNVTPSAFSLLCSTSGAVSLAVTGGPTTFTLDPAADLSNGETCTLTVVANEVTDQDANDPPDNMVANFTVGFTPFDVCQASYTPIFNIQGSGSAAAITGTVTTSGVVVGDFEGSAGVGIGGFYLQDPAGDGDVATSDGIFVYTGTADTVAAGDVVRVTGFARERFNQTTINGSNNNSAAVPAANIVKCGTGSVPATDVLLPMTAPDGFERYEGMLVRLPQALVISEYFNFDRFGEIVMALPRNGESRLFTPTAVETPGTAALARAADNALRQITLDDGLGAQNPPYVRHPNGQPFSLSNRFRGGDTVQNIAGVLGFDFDVYRIQPTAGALYTSVNPRTASPADVGGTVRVASMNTLNFFLTLDYPTGDPLDNTCGPLQNVESRGADADQPTEFTRQRDKLIAALASLDADVIGLNELENTLGVEPLGDPTNGVVKGLNDLPSVGTYGYINTGVIGTDAIRVGMIYRTTRVAPIGPFKILDSTVDPRFLDTKNRPSLAQTFEVLSTGARFTVVVNHLKSRGSDCLDVGDPDTGDGQGNCNLTRKAAAQALVDWVATDPTGSGDTDVILVGDFNSYTHEDPITAVTAGSDDTANTLDDFTNLVAKYVGVNAYSYLFDAQVGYLDHALASRSLTAQITGTTEFHINADEPDLLDYDTSFKPPPQQAIYEPNGYRTSDHDPVVVGIATMHYVFTGFSKLVFDAPTFNSENAGSAIPVKFSLGGYKGTDIFLASYPLSYQISCDAAGTFMGGPETENPGNNNLSYAPGADEYNYVWKTNRAWRSTCRRFVVVFSDGSVHYVNVAFR